MLRKGNGAQSCYRLTEHFQYDSSRKPAEPGLMRSTGYVLACKPFAALLALALLAAMAAPVFFAKPNSLCTSESRGSIAAILGCARALSPTPAPKED